MVASHNQLHIDITADCTSAVDAFQETKSQLRSLNHETASISVGLSGAQDATNQMEQVRQARMAAGGSVRVGVNSDDVDDAQRKLGGYRREVQGLSKDLEPIGRSKLNVSLDSGAVRQAKGDVDEFSRSADRGRVSVDGMAGSVRAASDEHEQYGRSVRGSEQSTRGLISAHGDAERSFAGMSSRLDDLGDRADNVSGRLAAHGDALRSFGASGAESLNRISAAGGDVDTSGIEATTKHLRASDAAARDAAASHERFQRSTRGSGGSLQRASHPVRQPAMAMAGGGEQSRFSGPSMGADDAPSGWPSEDARQAHIRDVHIRRTGNLNNYEPPSGFDKNGRVPPQGPPPQGPPPSKGYGGGSGDGEGEGGDDFSKWQKEMEAQKDRNTSNPFAEHAEAQNTGVEKQPSVESAKEYRQRQMDALKRASEANAKKPPLNQWDADRMAAQSRGAAPIYEGKEAQNAKADKEMRDRVYAKRDAKQARADAEREREAFKGSRESEVGNQERREAEQTAGVRPRDTADARAARIAQAEREEAARKGGGGGPPKGPRGPFGGGGDDFSKWERELGGGGGSGLGKDELGALKGMMGPASMGAMVAGGGSVITGLAGFEAAKQAIKHNPALAQKMAEASRQYAAGVTKGAAGADTGANKEKLDALGDYLNALGVQVGESGKAALPAAVDGLKGLAATARQGLNDVKPELPADVSAVTNVTKDAIKGVTSPAARQGEGNVAKAFNSKDNNKGIGDAISGVIGAAAPVLTAAGDAGGMVHGAFGSGGEQTPDQNIATTLSTVGGAILAAKAGINPAIGAAAGANTQVQQQKKQDTTGGILSGIGTYMTARAFGANKSLAGLLGVGADVISPHLPSWAQAPFKDTATDAGAGSVLGPVGAVTGAIHGVSRGVAGELGAKPMQDRKSWGEGTKGAVSDFLSLLGGDTKPMVNSFDALNGEPLAPPAPDEPPPPPKAPPLPQGPAVGPGSPPKGGVASQPQAGGAAPSSSGPIVQNNPDGTYSIENKGISKKSGEPYDFTDTYGADHQQTGQSASGISAKTGQPYNIPWHPSKPQGSQSQQGGQQDKQKPVVSPSGRLRMSGLGKDLGGGQGVIPPFQGSPGSSFGGGDYGALMQRLGIGPDDQGQQPGPPQGQSPLSSALPNASAVGAFSGMSDAANAAQGTPQQSSVPAQPPSQAQQQPPTPSQGQPPSPSQGQQSAAPQPSSGGGGDSGSGGADPKKIDSPRFDEPPEIGDLSAVPGQPGMFTGIVTNEFDNPQVSFNANTGKVTSINPNNQHEDVQGQPQTSLSHADVDGFGPAGRGYSQAMQSQVANSFSSKANPPDPYTMSMLNQSEHPDQTSHSQATAPGVGRGQAAAPGHGQGAPGLGVGHANMSQANPAQANAMANAPAALGAAPGMGQGLAAQAAVTAMSTALSSLSSHATQATQTQNSLAQSFGQVSQNSQANTQNQSQQNTAQQGLAQSNTSVSTSANSATNSVSNMSTAMDSTNASAQGLSQGAQSMSANVSDAVSGAQAGMAGLSSSMGQSGAQAGAAAMGGMAAGMSAGAADASASASDAGSGVGAAGADGAGDGAGAQSPSKKTRQIGLWLGEGLVIGMQNSAGSAVKAGKNLGQSAVDGAVAAQTAYNTTLAGGFGAGLIAASNGVTPIAQDYGLMLGYSWAQNVVTGAQSVFQSSQFTNLTTPQFASALAQRNEGLLGMLPPAGQGAEYYQTTSGSAGMVQMAPVVNATIQVSVDGTPLQVIAQNVVTASMNDLVDSINGQRG